MRSLCRIDAAKAETRRPFLTAERNRRNLRRKAKMRDFVLDNLHVQQSIRYTGFVVEQAASSCYEVVLLLCPVRMVGRFGTETDQNKAGRME